MRGYQSKKSSGRWFADTLVATLAIGSLFAGYMVAIAGVNDGRLDENLSTYYYKAAEMVAPSEKKIITPPTRGVYAKGAVESKAVSHLNNGLDASSNETEQASAI